MVLPILGYLNLPMLGSSASAWNIVGTEREFLLIEFTSSADGEVVADVADCLSQDEFWDWYESESVELEQPREILVVDHDAGTHLKQWPMTHEVRAEWRVVGRLVESKSWRTWLEDHEPIDDDDGQPVRQLICQELLKTTGVPHGERLEPEDLGVYGSNRFLARTTVPRPGGDVLNGLLWLCFVVGLFVLILYLFSTW